MQARVVRGKGIKGTGLPYPIPQQLLSPFTPLFPNDSLALIL